MFVTSHILEIIERICTHVGIISHGKLVEQTSLSDLRRTGSLEQRFLEIVGGLNEPVSNLSWLDAAAEQAPHGEGTAPGAVSADGAAS